MTSTSSYLTTPHPAHTLLSRAHPESLATQIFATKIENKPLLLTPSTPTSDARVRRCTHRLRKQQHHQKHTKPKPLSAKEKRHLRIYDLDPSEIRYKIYKGLNAMWQGYILEVLGFTRDGEVVEDLQTRVVSQTSHGSLIASADFHGMEIEVVRCVDTGRVGLRGIVVRETKGSLVLVTEGDTQRQVLKRGTVFRVVVELPAGARTGIETGTEEEKERDEKKRKLVFELYGNQLEVKPVDRAVRKCKWHPEAYR